MTKKKIFICHQKNDEKKIREVIEIFNLYNIHSWVDYKDLLPGESWKDKIEREIKSTDNVLIFISKTAKDTEGYFHKEILFALERIDYLPPNQERNFVIPILMDSQSELYPRLKEYHHVKMSESDWIEKTLKAINIKRNFKKHLPNYNDKYEVYEQIKIKEEELTNIWKERDKNEVTSYGYRHFEDLACEMVDNLILLKEQVGETFIPEIIYRNIKLSENEKLRERFENESVYLDGNCVCVPSRFIGKHIYVVEIDKPPSLSSSCDGRVVKHIIGVPNANGNEKLLDVGDGWVNHRGIIKKDIYYDIYDDTNNLAYKIGTLKG